MLLRARTRTRASAVLAALSLFVVGCGNQKPQSGTATSRATSHAAPLARGILAHPAPHHVDAISSALVFLIVARTSEGDFVSGTCFYLSRPSGRWLITANHVIREAVPGTIFARIGSSWVRLQVISQDQASDLAALLPSGPMPKSSLTLRSDSPHRGEMVSFTGFPIPDAIGASAPTTVHGPVTDDTATVGGIADFKIAAPTTGGDSGAPVLDSAGSVVGVVIYSSDNRQSAFAVEGFNIEKLLSEGQP